MKTYTCYFKRSEGDRETSVVPFRSMRPSFAKGAMAAFRAVSGLEYRIECRCDQTDEVLDVANKWTVTTG